MGDNTNLAARVEKLTRERGARIIVTGSTRAELGSDFQLQNLGTTQVKGRETPVELFAVLGVVEEL
jgi:adenylate cyclase